MVVEDPTATGTTSLAIRFARVEDSAAAARLLAAQLEEHHLQPDPAGIEAAVAAALDPSGRAWLLLAEAGGEPVAVALGNELVSVEYGGRTLMLEELYVAPQARRLGHARALLAFLSREARARGFHAIELEVVPTNAPAVRLYEALGFQGQRRLPMTLALR